MTYDELRRIAATKRLQPGDPVVHQGREYEVVDNTDPGLVTLRSEHGATFKLGRLFVETCSRE